MTEDKKTIWQHLMEPVFILPPHIRAEVMKVRITERETTRRELEATKRKIIEEREATRRVRVEQRELTHRELGDKDAYHAVRAMFVVFLALGLWFLATCVSAWHDIRSKQVAGVAIPDFNIPIPAAPSASASASASATPQAKP